VTTPPEPIPDSHRDLLEAPGVGVLTTVGRDGLPQSTAVWYMRDGDVIRTSLITTRQKYRNLVRHPLATLFVFDPTNPYRTVEVRGDASIEDDPGTSFFDQIIRHYGQGPETFPAPREGRVILTIRPRRVVTNG
jgi:PPOX class probable F420-dependent enzyme